MNIAYFSSSGLYICCVPLEPAERCPPGVWVVGQPLAFSFNLTFF